jgi:hypothetical protein
MSMLKSSLRMITGVFFLVSLPGAYAAPAGFATYTSEAAWLSSVTNPTLIDFDSLADGTAVLNQFPGVSFASFNGGTPLAAAESFPYSLPNVLSVDNLSFGGGGGGVSIGFASPQTGMGFWYNDAQFPGNTVTVYGSQNQILGTFELVFPHPTEWQFVGFRSSGNDITRVEIAMADADRVTLDNVQFSSPPLPTTPLASTGFTNLALAAIPNEPVRAAFLGQGAGQAGVYLFDSAIPTDLIRPIVDMTTAIPAGSGAFTGFTDLALAAIPQEPVRVAFLGQGAGQAGV